MKRLALIAILAAVLGASSGAGLVSLVVALLT